MDNFPIDHSSLLEIIQTKLKEGFDVKQMSELLLKKCIYVPVSILEFIKEQEEKK